MNEYTTKSNVSLWGNFEDGEYNDKKLFETEKIMVVRYCGQKLKKSNEKYIGIGNCFFFKNNEKEIYKFAGRVIHSNFIRTEIHSIKNKKTDQYQDYSINIFELVISKRNDVPFPIRIKHDIYEHFGWEKYGKDYREGIIKHTLLLKN